MSSTVVTLTVNGLRQTLAVDNRTTLLDALREELGLIGSRKGCDHGQCGACTVLVNGRRICSCLALAAMHDGDEVVTIEGLARPDGELHPLQAAFIEEDAFQCGYCTSGQICSAVGMRNEFQAQEPSVVTECDASPKPTDDELRERMSGNLCRCGAYVNILSAVRRYVGGE